MEIINTKFLLIFHKIIDLRSTIEEDFTRDWEEICTLKVIDGVFIYAEKWNEKRGTLLETITTNSPN